MAANVGDNRTPWPWRRAQASLRRQQRHWCVTHIFPTLPRSPTPYPQLNPSTFGRPTKRSPSNSSSCPLPVSYFPLPTLRDGRADNLIEVYTFHRSVLQQLLAKHLDPNIHIHFSKRLISYVEPPETCTPVALQFRDGTSVTCDVLIGSDGIRSAVRRSMFNALADEASEEGNAEDSSWLRSMVDPVWSGQIAYRGLIPTVALKALGFKDAGLPWFVSRACSMLLVFHINSALPYPSSSGRTR